MRPLSTRPIISAGILLGAGLGAFVDGILLHQILQWHSMLSSIRPPTDLVATRLNVIWDGIFHVFAWIMVVLGLWRLWRAAGRAEVPMPSGVFIAALVLGWGLFNVVEGIVDHQLLGIHHVHPGPNHLAWDLGFLLLGLAQIIASSVYLKARARRPTLELVKG